MRETQLSFFEAEEASDVSEVPAAANGCERNALERKYSSRIAENLQIGTLVSYQGNKKLPLLRLFRYKEAFSQQFVRDFFREYKIGTKDYVLDPFCGMGTTLLTACINGISSIGVDRLPTGVFVASTLPKMLDLQPGALTKAFERASKFYPTATEAQVADDVQIMKIAFPPEHLSALRKWKTAIVEAEPPCQEVLNLLYLSIIESCSFTSKDGQFLRFLPEKQTYHPTDLLTQKVKEAEQDLLMLRQLGWNQQHILPCVVQGDTRDLSDVPFEREPSFILTSPPYANRYDYTRSYSLELCFNFVDDFDALKELRFGILRSHIEVKADKNDVSPHPAVAEVLNRLAEKNEVEKMNNLKIPVMLLAYFVDMHKVVKEWSRVCVRGARVAMVVDNVRFEGEHVPVDLILSDLAEQEGFEVEKIIVARYKGNSSQQMGKYGRLPVRESITIWRKK